MNRQDRAKQFAPFEALKGLREALAEKELEYEKNSRKVVSEETLQEIQNTIIKIKKNDEIQVICYENGFYVLIKGKVKKIDTIYKCISIGDGKVFFDDIYEIKIL